MAALVAPGDEVSSVYGHDGLARMTTASFSAQHSQYFQYSYDAGSEMTQQIFPEGNFINYSYANVGQLKMAQGFEADGATPRLQEQFGYAYDKAWNLSARTNNALVQSFAVNSVNQLNGASRSGTLTVAGTTTEPGAKITSVTVNGATANEYADGTFAAAGFNPANGLNTYTAVASDTCGRSSTYFNDGRGNVLGLADFNDLYESIANTPVNLVDKDGSICQVIFTSITWQ